MFRHCLHVGLLLVAGTLLPVASAQTATQLPANQGAFQGGVTGTKTDAGTSNVLPPSLQIPAGSFNIPTNSKPSPMFGAQSYVQQMLLFEEFGPEPLNPNGPVPSKGFPTPTMGPLPEQNPASVAASVPAGATLELSLIHI